MPGWMEYVGCRIIVQDTNSNTTIADTKVLSCDRQNDVVTLSRTVFSKELPERVSVLVFADQQLFEYRGTVRKGRISQGLVDIALYRGRNKESRGEKRYIVNTIAIVDHLIIGKKPIPLRKRLEVLVVDMSSGGCLIKADSGFFNVNSSFLLTIEYMGSTMTISTTVLRIKTIDAHTAEFGCKFQFSSQKTG